MSREVVTPDSNTLTSHWIGNAKRHMQTPREVEKIDREKRFPGGTATFSSSPAGINSIRTLSPMQKTRFLMGTASSSQKAMLKAAKGPPCDPPLITA